VVPDHAPFEVDSVWPTTAEPLIAGDDVDDGAVGGGGGGVLTAFETVAETDALALCPLPGFGYAVTPNVCVPLLSFVVSSEYVYGDDEAVFFTLPSTTKSTRFTVPPPTCAVQLTVPVRTWPLLMPTPLIESPDPPPAATPVSANATPIAAATSESPRRRRLRRPASTTPVIGSE
jgi:hypothetical protein